MTNDIECTQQRQSLNEINRQLDALEKTTIKNGVVHIQHTQIIKVNKPFIKRHAKFELEEKADLFARAQKPDFQDTLKLISQERATVKRLQQQQLQQTKTDKSDRMGSSSKHTIEPSLSPSLDDLIKASQERLMDIQKKVYAKTKFLQFHARRIAGPIDSFQHSRKNNTRAMQAFFDALDQANDQDLLIDKLATVETRLNLTWGNLLQFLNRVVHYDRRQLTSLNIVGLLFIYPKTYCGKLMKEIILLAHHRGRATMTPPMLESSASMRELICFLNWSLLSPSSTRPDSVETKPTSNQVQTQPIYNGEDLIMIMYSPVDTKKTWTFVTLEGKNHKILSLMHLHDDQKNIESNYKQSKCPPFAQAILDSVRQCTRKGDNAFVNKKQRIGSLILLSDDIGYPIHIVEYRQFLSCLRVKGKSERT